MAKNPTNKQIGERVLKNLNIEKNADGSFNLPASDRFPELIKKIITMEELIFFEKGLEIPFYKNNEAWKNGLKTFILQGLYNVDINKDIYANLTIADFNSDENPRKELIFQCTEEVYTKYHIFDKEIADAFASTEALGKFISGRIKNMFNTRELYMAGLKNAFVWGIQNTDFSSSTDINVTYDKEVELLTEEELITDAGMKNFLRTIREQLIDYTIPHKKHLAMNDVKFLYANVTSHDLVLLVKKSLYAQVADLTAQLFNKDDVMRKIKMKPMPVDNIKGYDEDRDGGKLAILYDQRKLRLGVFILNLGNSVRLPLFRSMYESYAKFGFASLPTYPAILYKKKTETKNSDLKVKPKKIKVKTKIVDEPES